jgi:DNA-binding transcriptional ArsR family regulator
MLDRMTPARRAPTRRRAATEAEAKALASPVRLRILRVCLHEPHTNKEISQALSMDPATVLHHVRTLVDAGFLAAQEVRRGVRGAREIPYLATRKSWTTSTPAQSHVLLETFLEEVSLVPAEQLNTARLGLQLSEAQRTEFERRLQVLLDEFADLPTDPAGEAWSVFLALHPDPNRPG